MINKILFLVPTRGRPDNVRRLIKAFEDTHAFENAHLLFLRDDDDTSDCTEDNPPTVRSLTQSRQEIGPRINSAALKMADQYLMLGFMGDDHVPQTPYWALSMALNLLDHDIVYGNDLFQGERLPTAWAMTSDVVRALGYMAPPTLKHMYLDNFILDLGRACGVIGYLPQVVIEHRHHLAGKTEKDESYARSEQLMNEDAIAYSNYKETQFARDVEKVNALLDNG